MIARQPPAMAGNADETWAMCTTLICPLFFWVSVTFWHFWHSSTYGLLKGVRVLEECAIETCYAVRQCPVWR